MEWTDTERSGHRAFLLVEAVGPLVLAPILTMIYVGLRGHVDAYDESFITVYFIYVAGLTVALSVIAIPISVAWAVVRVVARDQSLGAAAFGRLLLVEGFIVAVCALSSNVLWPLQHDPWASGGPVELRIVVRDRFDSLLWRSIGCTPVCTRVPEPAPKTESRATSRRIGA